jgi:cell wall-associated NlpC family hydrolase
MDEIEVRRAIVDEAYSWLKTPYHHQAHLKGVGVDCVWLLLEVYKKFGMVSDDFHPGNYSRDWYLHKSEEIYLAGVQKFARRLESGESPKPADVALYKVGHCISHGAILVSDELVIHANVQARQVELTELRGPLAAYFHSFWTPFR